MTRCTGIISMVMGWMLLLASSSILGAADAAFAPRYQQIFITARAAWQASPTNRTAAWQFARACYDWAEFATNGAQKIEIAKQGIAVARELILREPKLAAAHYYLAMNLGQLADATRNFGGLKLVSEMEREFKKTAELDAQFDFAGADRSLGLLYRDAPGWPISVGSRTKARIHLERACELTKTYPDNQLTLLEAWLKWSERAKVLAQLDTMENLLATARKQLAGEEWASAWADWDQRWWTLQTKLKRTPRRPAASLKGGN